MSGKASKKRKSTGLPFILIVAAIVCRIAVGIVNNSPDTDRTLAIDSTTSYNYVYATRETTEKTGYRDYTEKTTRTTRTTTQRTTTAPKVNWWETTTGTTADKTTAKITTEKGTTANNKTTAKKINEPVPERPVCMMYKSLSDAEKRVYNSACENLSVGKTQYSFIYNGTNYQSLIDKLSRAIWYDHPEFFWLKRYTGWESKNVGGDTKYTVTYDTYEFWDYIVDKQKYIDAFNRRVSEIANLASKYSSDYTKIQYVHNYLILNNVYDNEAAEHNKDSNMDAKYAYSYTAYGCLMNKKCVCAGYSRAFQAIAQKLGHECVYVNGPVSSGGYHAWNCINIGGKYYNVDVTWDDRNDSGYNEAISYLYFCTPDSEFYIGRSMYDYLDIPKCTSSDLKYYRRNNCFVSVYTPEGVERVLAKQKNSQCVGIEFMNPTQADIAYKELRNNKKIWSISALKENKYYSGGSLNFLCSDDGKTIEVFIK